MWSLGIGQWSTVICHLLIKLSQTFDKKRTNLVYNFVMAGNKKPG